MEDCKTLFCSSDFAWAHERIYSKFMSNLWHAPLQSFASPDIEDNMKITAHVSVLCIPTYVSEILSHGHGKNLTL